MNSNPSDIEKSNRKNLDLEARAISDKIDHLRKLYFESARDFDFENYSSSARITSQAAADLKSLLAEFKSFYLRSLENRKFPWLATDFDPTKLFADPSLETKDILTLLRHLRQFHKSLVTAEREFKWMFGIKPWFWTMFMKHRRLAAGGIATIVLLLLVNSFVLNRSGLQGDYFRDNQLTHKIKSRIDHTVDFDWGFFGPFDMKDNFSIRWTGTLLAPEPGEYDLVTRSDDGVRLWLDDRLLIDHWNPHAAATDKATLTLTKGPHNLKMEYHEDTRRALIQLLWKQPNDDKTAVISSDYLRPRMSQKT